MNGNLKKYRKLSPWIVHNPSCAKSHRNPALSSRCAHGRRLANQKKKGKANYYHLFIPSEETTKRKENQKKLRIIPIALPVTGGLIVVIRHQIRKEPQRP
ncbi:hypothetical protein, unlikely [Trypanosoma brucei brucei TREU927]|uniref:Uncharacterized protein n=1 Tax=Trypanosoma brucei brucei (strain 927/4 GUTat10.1) TaxID=185431 RepID=Q4GYM0_TRYB2|nr:hypothetical protein, unlikely [Trypanosoma brucei brucei TREU927]CAJ16564.1 hypothetical protein, unlikely [Trypanosoma brucei brucei TREU927]